MIDRLVTTANLGAWLVKCNADVTDIVARARTQPVVERWCVQRSYRTALTRAGQRLVFWVGGGRGRVTGGIWGVGHLAGPARPADDPAARWQVDLDLRLLPADARVPRSVLRADPRLAGMEVFRQPQAANPSFVTVEQLAALTDYVDWPPAPPA